jgi:hypothetical protein
LQIIKFALCFVLPMFTVLVLIYTTPMGLGFNFPVVFIFDSIPMHATIWVLYLPAIIRRIKSQKKVAPVNSPSHIVKTIKAQESV